MTAQQTRTLLDISLAIATVRDKQDLFRVIKENAQRVLPVSPEFFHIYLWRPQQREVELYLQITLPEYATDPVAQRVLAHRFFPVTPGDPVDQVLEAAGAVSVFTAAYCRANPAWWASETILHFGLDQLVGAPLWVGGRLLGYVNMFASRQKSFSTPQLDLLTAVADQLAVAVANILANEELLEREREKVILLSVSESIAAIHNRQELLTLVYDQIRPALPFDYAGLFYFCDASGKPTPRGDHHVCLLTGVLAQNPSYPEEDAVEVPVLPGTPELRAFTKAPAALGVMEDFLRHCPDSPYLPKMVRLGIKQFVGGPLRHGGNTIGVLLFDSCQPDFYSQRHFPLFIALANLLSTALSNLLAHEELVEREREKTLQIALHTSLSEPEGWENKFRRVGQVLQPHIPFDYLVFDLGGNGPGGRQQSFRFERIGADEYRLLGADSFTTLTGLTPAEYATLAEQVNLPDPTLLKGADFAQFRKQHKLIEVVVGRLRLRAGLQLPLPLSRQGTCRVALYSRQATAYTWAHLALLKRLALAFRPTLEKLLAYEEIQVLNEQLEQEKEYLREELQTTYNFEEIIGSGPALQQVFRRLSQVAPTDATVLLEGETGTGKELFARALHQASPRYQKVLVKINCAALPAQLIESELFGHEKGAFTGAHERRVGKFELAHGGTLFLDEIGEMPLELQPKLLRVLQEKEFERLGGNKVFQTDVRIVAATNRDLEREVAEGRFRADLFFRLSVVPLRLPALRERREDIPLLARHFLHKFSKRFGKPVHGFSAAALQEMQAYDWPGNVRELEHLIEQSLILSESAKLELSKPLARTGPPTAQKFDELPARTWQEAERANILAALRQTDGRIRGPRGAAQLLDINANTLDARMEKLGIGKAYLKKENR